MKSERNRLVPISKLPPEVLCAVLFYATLEVEHKKWIKLSHVCRHWRYLSLRYPSLWANPPLGCIRWTEIMLARSKAVGLTLQTRNDDALDSEFASNIIQSLSNIFQNHNSRIQHININLSLENTSLLKRLPSFMPRLESLVIAVPDVGQHLLTSSSDTMQDYDFRIMDESLCDMDRLRQMELTGIQINWDLHLPSTLTILKLHNIPNDNIPQMNKLQDILERMPLLQSLDLADVLPDIANPLMSLRDIQLPKLQTLRLSAGLGELECLLQHLTFPSTTVVELVCKQRSPSHYFDMSGIFTTLSRSQDDGRTKINTLDLALHHIDNFLLFDFHLQSTWEIRAFTSVNVPGHTASRSILLMDLKVVWFQSASIKSGKVLRELVQNFSLDNVRSLSLLGSVDSLSVKTILSTVGALPRVCTLTAQLEPNLVRALKSNLRSQVDHSNRTSKISFPSLRNLVLKGELIEDFAGDLGDVTVEMLLACLARRSGYGAPVKSLNLEECKGADRVDAVRFKKVAEEVDWDSDIQSEEDRIQVWKPEGWRYCDEVEIEENELFLNDYDEHVDIEGCQTWYCYV